MSEREPLVATIRLTLDEVAGRTWLEGIYAEAGDEPAPEVGVYFRERVAELVDDELSCALMFSPIEAEVGDLPGVDQ